MGYNIWLFLTVGLISFFFSYFLTFIVQKLSVKWHFFDVADERKIHKDPIPYGGGIAIYLSFFIAIIFAYNLFLRYQPNFSPSDLIRLKTLFIASTIIVIVGVWDDLKALSPLFKFVIQCVCAGILIYFGFYINFITNPFDGLIILPRILSIIISLLWIVGLMNAINFMDGLDGLVAGVTVISGFLFLVIAIIKGQFLVALLLATLIGSSLGFLRFNFNPAKIFMGDAGALFIGLVFGALSIQGALKITTAVALLIPLCILALPIFDSSYVVLKRLTAKKPVFYPDKTHFHHRLLSKGFSQRKVVLIIYAINAFLGSIGLALAIFIK